MYETVKVVKGYEIKRMKGTRGAYHVNVREGKGFREFHTFRSERGQSCNKGDDCHSPCRTETYRGSGQDHPGTQAGKCKDDRRAYNRGI